MTFLPRGLHQWRPSMQTPHPQRTTRWRLPTPTTAATGTTPNPTMTPTPTHATMETLARPSLLLLMVPTDTHRPRTQDTVTVQWSQHQARPHCPATRSPRRQRRHRLPMAATRSRHPRLWWSPQTLPRPLLPWCAATALWASNRRWRPRTGSTRTPTRWARPRWSGWVRCPSWCPPRAEQARWSEVWFGKLLALKTRQEECLVVTFDEKADRVWAEAARCPLQLCLSCMSLYFKTNWDFTVHLMPIPRWTGPSIL